MQKLTPLLKQYFRIKSAHEDSILLFRMGDFYETFFKDAEIASKILQIVLTSRSHAKGNRIPLAGIPVKAADNYIAKLIKAGFKVAICEQLEDPALAKGIVKRDVVEVITPGTITNPNILDGGKNIFLAAVKCNDEKKFGLSYCDLSTGDFYIEELEKRDLLDELKRIEPGEIIIAENETLSFGDEFVITKVTDMYFEYEYARQTLMNHFNVETLDGFDVEELYAGIAAGGAILKYLTDTQKSDLKHIKAISRVNITDKMMLDSSTIRNLELIRRFDGSIDNTLLSTLNETITPMGTRYLRMNLLNPLSSIKEINKRLESVEELVDKSTETKKLREILKSISDLERLIGRISTERSNARELIQLKKSLEKIPELKKSMIALKTHLLRKTANELLDFTETVRLLENSIVDEPPISIKEGGIIKNGFDDELDEIRITAKEGKQWIINLQKEERSRTHISSLKVGYNSVFGYYIEVTRPNLKLVPDNYIRKQTLSNCERFITPELKEYESRVLTSEERISKLEYNLFVKVREKVREIAEGIQTTAKAVALLDLLLCFAFLSRRNNYKRPTISDSDGISIIDGRHPVVENVIEKETFIPNDVILNNTDNQILIITGPNMSGKSTYLRQVALIVIMAHMGCFVPAKQANIGKVDRVFTRIGATDDLSKGVSTFLAEMIETAKILNNATLKSLVIMDEVGRGTSTFDGLSIAWSVCEFLHNNQLVHPKTLFATHYHELTELETLLDGVKNYNVSVKRWGDRIIFLRKVLPGGADESYGVDVARLAGLPLDVISRAREILEGLEEKENTSLVKQKIRTRPKGETNRQLSLFTPIENLIIEKLKSIDITKMTPLEAINLLNEWRDKLKNTERTKLQN